MKFEVRLTGDRPAIIRGLTMNPPALLKATTSIHEAMGTLQLHDRARCFNSQGEELSTEQLLELLDKENQPKPKPPTPATNISTDHQI